MPHHDHLDEPAPVRDTVQQRQLLHTPAQAAQLLSIKESWLRRQAGRRAIPSTLVGKHLRFSDHDLAAIVDAFRRPPRGTATRTPHYGRNRRREKPRRKAL
jgi:hypothetical protein